MAFRQKYRAVEAAQRRAHRRLAPHDHPDGGPHRDSPRARSRSPVGELQHLLDPGPRGRRGRRRSRMGLPRIRKGPSVFAWKGESLPEYWWCTMQAFLWPDGKGPNMLLDDGGDATLLVHKGVEVENAGKAPSPETADNEEFRVVLTLLGQVLEERKGFWTGDRREHQGRKRGNDDRRPPPVSHGEEGLASLPGVQRERLGHQEQIRQHLRLPAFARGRNPEGDGRHALGKARLGLRLWRRRKGLRPGALRAALPGGGDRDRSHLRAPGVHGRFRSGAARATWWRRRTSS